MTVLSPLDAPFGVEIAGLDLRQPISPADMETVSRALYAYRMVVIRGQEGLDLDEYLAFGSAFGEPIAHVLDHLRMPGYPGLMAVGNTEPQHRDPDVRNGAAFWHTDQSYEAEPASATMLLAAKAPRTGGETMICDCAGAYDALSDEMKARIEGLVALHFYGAASGRDAENVAAPLKGAAQAARVPPVRHPVARRHPVSGRRSIYAMAGTPTGIEGMAQAEADELIATLKAHVLQPRFIHAHAYRVGDIVIWDNAQTLHCAAKVDFASGETDSRLLYRISCRGYPQLRARAA